MDFKRYIFSNIIKYKYQYIFGIFTLLIVDIIQLFIPIIIADVINKLEDLSITPKELLYYGGALSAIALAMAVLRFLWRYFIIRSSFQIGQDVREELMKKFYYLGADYFVRTKVGDLMSIVVNDVEAIRFFLGMGLVAMFDMSILASMAVGYMIFISGKLTLIALIPAPFIIAILYCFEGPLHRKFLSIQELLGKMSVKVQESIEGIALIKLYRLYGLKMKEFNNINTKYKKDNMFVKSVDALYFPIVHFFMMGILCVIIYYGGIDVIRENIKLGDFIAFTRYLEILIWPLIATGWVFSLYQQARSGYDRIQNVFQQENNILNSVSFEENISIKGKVEFKDVSFSYDSFSLDNINVKIDEKTLVGITGRIGSGKTTFINLMLRLYDVDSGEIVVDKRNIKEYNLKNLRNSIAYVPQETFLFSQSVIENLKFANKDATDEEIETALKISDSYDFVYALPEKLDTVIGERGVSLSGGQKQRLALARALLLKRPFILMDDCLSAVDSQTEKVILENLKKKWSGSTSIVVSHRLTAFKEADNILVFDQGEIKETGTHNYLKENSIIYKGLYRKQQLEEELENA